MKEDRTLNVDDLESELFIDGLGDAVGGQGRVTTLAMHEGPDWSDTPSWGGQLPPISSDYVDSVYERIRDVFGPPPAEVSTMALGEE